MRLFALRRHPVLAVAAVALSLLLLRSAPPARAIGPTDLLPFGPAAGDITMAREDDDPSPNLSLLGIGPAGSSLALPFYGGNYTNFFINNNGNVTFNAALVSYSPTGFPTSPATPMIAPLWADVDTRAGTGTDSAQPAVTPVPPVNAPHVWNNQVFYRVVQDAPTLNLVSQMVKNSYLGAVNFAATAVEIITWDHVGYYNLHIDKANTFQLLIATDGMQTYSFFLYPTYTYATAPTSRGGINWTTGDANTAGTYPSVGFDAGDGTHYYNASGSRTSQVLNLPTMTNAIPANPGVQVFRVDQSSIAPPGATVGTAPVNTWNGGSGVWTHKGTGWGGAATTWSNTNSATFTNVTGGSPSTITLGGPIFVQELKFAAAPGALDTGYVFTASSAANSLQFNTLTLPDASSTVSFAGNLVVLTNQFIPGTSSTVSQGHLNFSNNSVLVARGIGAVNGGAVHLQNAAQLQIYSAGATTSATALSFDTTGGGSGGTLDLRGFNTAIGAISSVTAGAGIIKSSAASAAALTVSFDAVSSAYSGVIQNGGTGALSLSKSGTGTLTLSGANTYTGGTQINAGALAAGNASALGSGPVTVANGATLTGAVTLHGLLTVDSGGLVRLASGTLMATAGVTNNGVMRFAKGASLAVSGGTFTNNGVLDVMTGSYSAPNGFTNNGVVYDSSLIKAKSVSYQPASQQFTVTIDGYPGHTYRLEKSASLMAGFSSAGVSDQSVAENTASNPPPGPTTLTFIDNNQSAAQGFYRVAVDP